MARTLYMVHAEVAPDAEAAWNAWQREHHIPEVVRVGGFLGSRLLRDEASAPDGWSRYAVIYEAESRERLEAYLGGPAVAGLRADYAARFGSATRLSRQILVEPPGRDR